MISRTEIRKLTVKFQTLELNVRREYYQHLFLSYFYQQKNTESVFFKGGTALRIVYQSPRFSEDLDFSADLGDIKVLEQAILSTLQDIEREEIAVDLKEAKVTSGGYLAIVSFETGEEPVIIQLEISLRQGDKKGEVVTVANDFIPPYTIVSLRREQLVGEKIEALLSRKKPRDFYDLYYILRRGLICLDQKKLLMQAKEVLRSTEINFEMELKQFLPKSHWAIIRNFGRVLEREIERN